MSLGGMVPPAPPGQNSHRTKNRNEASVIKIDPEKFYTIGEVGEILRLSDETIRKRLKETRDGHPALDYIYDGTYRIPGSSIVCYIDLHSKGTKTKSKTDI